MLFSAKNLSFFYHLGSSKVSALKNLDLEIPEKQLVVLSGPSGSGKSSLLHLLGLIEPLQSGSLQFLGEEVGSMKKSRQNFIRKTKIGFVFQRFHLIPVLNVLENVSYFITNMGLSKKEIKKKTLEAIESVGLSEHLYKKPFELSGGQRQRVAIARALVKNPEVILADEPTANLDQQTGKQIMQMLQDLVKQGISVIICTHDPMVFSYADTHLHMQDGLIVHKKEETCI